MPTSLLAARCNALHPRIRVLGMLSIGALIHLGGAELVMRDLQADLTILPTAFSFHTVSPTVDATDSDHFRSGTGWALGGRRSFATPGSAWGIIASGELQSQNWTYGSDGSLSTYGLRAGAGVGWALNDHWTLALEPGISAGLSRLQLPATTGGPAYSSSGRQFGYDVRMDAGWQFAEQWVLRAQVGWMSSAYTGGENDGVTQDLTIRGLTVGLGIAWRISNAPAPLR